MTDAEQWTCPTCNTAVSTPYCPACGEHRRHAHELTLRGLFDQAVEAFTNLDARLLRSVRSLETMKTTLDVYAPVFNQAVAANAKSLIILMVLPFALLPPIVFYRSRLPFAAHLAFSLHFHAFMLLLISIALVVPAADVLFGGVGLASQNLDNAIAIVLLVLCATYLYLATGTVYGASGAIRMFKAVALVVAAASIFLGYRFLLLLITLYST